MAYDGRSDEFDLDDDGILRDSMSGADDLLMDDDGIMRGTDELDLYKHVTRGHWTDSGIGGDKQSVTSTLKNLQNSFEEDLAPIGDESINISEFEASKDELSEDEFGVVGGKRNRSKVGASLDLTDTMGDTLETPRADTTLGTVKRTSQSDFDKLASDFDNHQLFTPEYYNQLRELGVLVDGADLSRDSLGEFEDLESRVASRAGEADKEDDNRDLIGEYLESEYIREQMDEEDERRVIEKQEAEEREKRISKETSKKEVGEGKRAGVQRRTGVEESEVGGVDTSYSRPSSGRTVSSRTFPDDEDYFDEDEEEEEGDYRNRINESQNLGSQGGSQPARMIGDDDEDELYYINSRGGKTVKHRRQGSATPTGGARSRTPVISGARRSSQSPGLHDNNKRQRRYGDDNNNNNNNDDDYDDDARSVYSESATQRSRPSSVTSHMSTASENVSARQKRAEQLSLQRMSKAKSQESFFEDEFTTPRSGRSVDKSQQQSQLSSSSQHHHHKRLLPTPNTSISNDPNQSFKLKSKSVSNIAAAGPVKPTHMSISEITRLTNLNNSGEVEDENSVDKSTGELTDRLTQESQKRKHATELVQQLQHDYDNLLTKYALAELTIDQMRLGAKINVHTDSPTPGQAHTGVMSPIVGQSPQVLQLRSSPANAASVRSSPAQGVLGHVSPLVDSGNQTANVQTGTLGSTSDIRSQGSRLSIGDSEDGLREDAMTETEKVKADLQTQATGLDEKLETFYSMLENQQLSLDQEAGAFEQIRSEHDTLRRAYLTAKDDYNILKRSGAFSSDTQQQFDTNKELEGQLFRLGMRFDEVQERVEGNQAKMSPSRQPFQQDADRDNKKDQVDGRRGSADRVGSHPASPSILHPKNNHNHSMDSTDGGRITERRVNELRDDYNTGMDAYRKLKYADDSPEGQQEVDNVVRRLNSICSEMPEMFRLSPEIQDRWDNLEKRDKINLADRKNSVWEKLNQREQSMKSQRRSPVPQSPKHRRGSGRASPVDGRPPSILRQTSDSSDMDSLRLRLDGSSRSSLGSILPDRMDRPSSRQDRPSSRTGQHGDRDRPSSRNSNAGYDPDDPSRPGGSRDHNPSLPRPRRHDQRGVRDSKLAPMPHMGSMGSLPDSGISDQENGARRRNSYDRPGRQSPGGARGGATGGPDDVLNALPGSPYKKSGKARGADDADSGFLGSMVGSGVGLPPGAQQQQQQQQEDDQQRVLRLRRPAEESTSTDQSMDAADYQDRQRSSRSRQKRMQDAASSMTGQSYDASEDTLEDTREGDTSIERHMGGARGGSKGGATAKARRKSDSRDFSLDATLEEDYSGETDVSTPRAANQMPSKTKDKERRSSDSKATPSKERATPRRSTKQQSSSKQQSTSEDEDLKKAMELERARQSKSHRLQQDSSLDESLRQKRLKSPPPAMPRPKSRGSPTTDLYKTRERRASGDSVRSRRSVREEATREERREPQQSRAEFRMNQRGPDVERPRSRQSKHSDDLPRDAGNSEIAERVRDYESRSSIGSDVEVSSNLTRASSTNSNRLKLLQEEIEKLKEGVAKANEKASQPHTIHPQPAYPPPPQQPLPQPESQNQDPQRRDEPEFYDPFDDPYGFMRMPRRRANSFSGGREREWDEWYWTLPQNRQYDGADIPLGYAAADAYAELPPSAAKGAERNSSENVRNRLRQRRMGRRGRDDAGAAAHTAAAADQPQADLGARVVGGPTTLQPPTQTAPSARMNPGAAQRDDQAMYDYYVPSRYSTDAMRSQIASQGYFTTPSGAKIYSNTGGQQQGAMPAAPNASSPWYQIRRSARPSFGNANQEGLGTRMGGRRTQSYDDVRTQAQPIVYAAQPQVPAPGPQVSYGAATYSQTCPMCGVDTEHTHANYTHHATHQPQTYQTIPIYAPETSPTRAGRRRSKSASRSRHYTPERTPRSSRSRSRYHVREYDHVLSDSFSDDDRMDRGRRSRSLTRERSRSRPSSPVRQRRHRRKSQYSGSDDSDSMDGVGSLDKSLSLSVDISRLTKRMMGSLKGELRRSKDKREFGSSYW